MFQPGISGNTRGRPSGSLGGRAQALAALDRMLSKECNQQAIFDALEKELQADPAKFFRNTVVPLIPRSTREALPPDANDDWLPMDRTPPSGPPIGICSPPKLPHVSPPPVKGYFSEIPGLQPSVIRPQSSVFRLPSSVLSSLLTRLHSSLSNLKFPISNLFPLPSSLLSFACFSLLLIPFALKPDPNPHPPRTLVHVASARLSRIVCAARVSAIKGTAISGPRQCQPEPKEPCRLRMKGNGPVLFPNPHPLQTSQTLTHLTRSQQPRFTLNRASTRWTRELVSPLLFVVINPPSTLFGPSLRLPPSAGSPDSFDPIDSFACPPSTNRGTTHNPETSPRRVEPSIQLRALLTFAVKPHSRSST